MRTHNLSAIGLLFFLILGTGGAASAQDGLSGGLTACKRIADNAARLACYDGLQAGGTPSVSSAAVPSAPTAPAAAPQTAAATAPAASLAVAAPAPVNGPTGFGAETMQKRPDEAVQSVTAHLVGDIDGVRRNAVFRLDNGQMWKNADDHEYDFEADHPTVTIRRNAVGSYWLRFEGASFNLRVNREE